MYTGRTVAEWRISHPIEQKHIMNKKRSERPSCVEQRFVADNIMPQRDQR